MFLPVAILIYKLLKRFPFVIVFIYCFHFCGDLLAEEEKEITEKVESEHFTTQEDDTEEKEDEVTSNTFIKISDNVLEPQDKTKRLFVLTTHHKLYILYASFLVDHYEAPFRNV